MCIQMIIPSLCDLSCQTFFLLLVSYLLFVFIFVHFVSSVYHRILLVFKHERQRKIQEKQ